MIKKTITYKDLDNNPITGDFWFNLREDEIARMELSQAGGSLTEYLKAIVADNDGEAIINTFEKILAKAYGLRNADNVAFDKSDEISRHFRATDAYRVLFMELVTDAEISSAFINGLVPVEMQGKLSTPVLPAALLPEPSTEEAKAPVQDVEIPSLSPIAKVMSAPKDLSQRELMALSHDELVLLMRSKNSER